MPYNEVSYSFNADDRVYLSSSPYPQWAFLADFDHRTFAKGLRLVQFRSTPQDQREGMRGRVLWSYLSERPDPGLGNTDQYGHGMPVITVSPFASGAFAQATMVPLGHMFQCTMLSSRSRPKAMGSFHARDRKAT